MLKYFYIATRLLKGNKYNTLPPQKFSECLETAKSLENPRHSILYSILFGFCVRYSQTKTVVYIHDGPLILHARDESFADIGGPLGALGAVDKEEDEERDEQYAQDHRHCDDHRGIVSRYNK